MSPSPCVEGEADDGDVDASLTKAERPLEAARDSRLDGGILLDGAPTKS